MIEVARIWNNEVPSSRIFIVLNIVRNGQYASWKYFDSDNIWQDRIEYILANSSKLSPVLKELYE